MRHLQSLRARVLLTVVATSAALALPLAGSAASVAATDAGGAASSHLAAAAAAKVPRYNHIAVIMDTSHDYASIIHNRYAPNINRLARTYGLATHYYTTSDPDTANIMALLAGNSFGISDGSPYWDQPVRKTSLLSQLDKAHKSWKEYAQGLPYPGYLGDCYPGNCQQTDSLYNQMQFNSVPDLTSVADNPAEARKIVPASELAADARKGRLPDFSFIDPNECYDMHGGPPWCEDSSSAYHQHDDNLLVSAGDAYIGQVTREIMAGPQWRQGHNAIVITFTEGDTGSGCCHAKPGTGHVVTIVITNHEHRHVADGTPFNHYSLLHTIEAAFGLRCLRNACGLVPMAKLFGAKADSAARGVAAAHPAAAPRAGTRLVDASPARPAGAAVTSPWAVVTSPDVGADDNDLAAISGRSPTDIWAVGGMLPTANATIVRTLAVHYNRTKWSLVRTPNAGSQANSFYGVAAEQDGTAWATGIYTPAGGHTGRALTEHWNGHKWSIVPAVDPGSQDDMLYSATAVSDSDVWAVGGYSGADGFFRPLIERWNGHRWSVRRVAGLGAGHGVLTSVTSSAGQGVWATGQLVGRAPDQQVVLHLVGGSWRVVHRGPVRTPGGAVASAYPQAIAVSAAGTWLAGVDRAGHAGFSTLVEAPGAGGRLTEMKTPNPTPNDNYLTGVAAVACGHDAWAVGYSTPVKTGNASSLTEFGSASGGWQAVPSPDPGAPSGNTFLDGVLAFSSSDAWAVGAYDGASGMRTLIMHYTGGTI